jgi:hypothetical protein
MISGPTVRLAQTVHLSCKNVEVDDKGTFSKIFGEGIVGVVLVDDKGTPRLMMKESIVGVVLVDDEGTPRLTMRMPSLKYLEKVLLVLSWLTTKVHTG